jgi:hypothetical protein
VWTGYAAALQFSDQQSQQSLLEQIDGRREKNEVLHQECDVTLHGGESTGGSVPTSGIKGMILLCSRGNVRK